MKNILYTVQAVASAVVAWLLARMGLLFYAVCILAGAMVLDYLTGMLAAKREAIEHPDDPSYGWSSKKGAEGIIKKVGYLCIIAVAMTVDYVILNVAAQIGVTIQVKAFFGLLVAVWYILNELLSIIENAGRMGAPVPEWLSKYIAVLKNKIDDQGGENNGQTDH